MNVTRPVRWLASAHAIYWAGTGAWPFLHRGSFEYVTGPKTDFWLAQTVGLLLVVLGAGLFLAALRRRLTQEIVVMAAGGCLALVGIDVFHVLAGRIRPIYLLDAAIEMALAVAWLCCLWIGRRSPRDPRV